jgi:hypothetical protein
MSGKRSPSTGGREDSCDGRTHPLLRKVHIEIAQGDTASAGIEGTTFEAIFQIMIMVMIGTAHGDALLVALPPLLAHSGTRHCRALDGETTVGPQSVACGESGVGAGAVTPAKRHEIGPMEGI